MKIEESDVARLGLCAAAALSGQEGQRARKLEEQVTALFDELRQPLYSYLVNMSANSAEADEMVQETFLRLYKHLHAGGGEDNLRGWVFRVAHNIGINELKKRKHFSAIMPKQWAELINLNADPAPGPEELLLRKETMVRVHATISELSEQQRECLYLRAEGFRYREIAEILEVTVSTVAESLRRAITKLTKEAHGQPL